jgi:CBS domain-containing protein
MKASESMVPNPFVAVANASASEMAIMFKTRNISVVPVVDDHRTRLFLGVVSDRDLVTRCLAVGSDPIQTRADAIMRTDSTVVGPDTELKGFSLFMNQDPSDSHLRATITVVDSEHRVIGFISRPELVEGLKIIRR